MAKVKPAARRRARKAPSRGRSRRKPSQTKPSQTKPPETKPSETTRAAPAASSVSSPSDVAVEDQIISSDLSLHQLFEQQARQMIERADLDEEQKQNILVAMSCPCCGAGAMAFTARLRR